MRNNFLSSETIKFKLIHNFHDKIIVSIIIIKLEMKVKLLLKNTENKIFN